MKIIGYGWSPDLPDHRDYTYRPKAVQLPPVIDLRPQCPLPYDQGELGSCTANAIANCYKFVATKEKLKLIDPSRLFIYYNERLIENTVPYDAGAEIRDGFKTLANQGVCTEKSWPYVISKFARKPNKTAYTGALKHEGLEYQRIDNTNLTALKQCLSDGYTFVFGFTVYDSFESTQVAKTGLYGLPTSNEKVIGGHAVLCVGYDDRTQRFIVMNSWGTTWGIGGYFTIPYMYLTNTNLADDFWTLRKVS
jgi:C1A family cysteine protease